MYVALYSPAYKLPHISSAIKCYALIILLGIQNHLFARQKESAFELESQYKPGAELLANYIFINPNITLIVTWVLPFPATLKHHVLCPEEPGTRHMCRQDLIHEQVTFRCQELF